MLQKIIDFVLKFKDYITFVALVVISLSLISLNYTPQMGGFRTAVVGTIGWMQNMFSWIPNPVALKNENQALRELNLSLSSEVTRMRNALIENDRLRQLADFRKNYKVNYIPCEVVGRITVEMRNYVTLNKGRSSGLREGMAVRNDAGLVGLVTSLSDHYSLVETILNRNVRIAGKDQRNGYGGVIVWDGSENFLMKNIPKSYDFQAGDIVITSDASSRYPEDIPVGQVVSSTEEAGDLFMKVVVRPMVNFSTLEQVFVLTELPDPERLELIKDFENKVKTTKKK